MASIKRIGKDSLGVPIWQVRYRRGGKQVMRHIHAATRDDVNRQVMLDTSMPGAKIRWSEGWNLYAEAKRLEGRGSRHNENVERAVTTFTRLMGDLVIEETSADAMKDFMQRVTREPVKNRYSGKTLRLSGPKVANHHRKELLTIARYLLRHAGKIHSIPFEHVPPLSVKSEIRKPIPAGQVFAYMEALPPHVRRPVMMILYYGLRSTATCQLLPTAPEAEVLFAVDKGGVERRIPVDDTLREVLADAAAWRGQFPNPADVLFVNAKGRAWTRMTLLHAAQKAWEAAGLEVRKLHEVRHTLGTLAGRSFSPGMVQAAMGHKSRKSSEAYFHPTEEMAAEVRQKIIADLSHIVAKDTSKRDKGAIVVDAETGEYTCPCCGCKLLIHNN